MVFHIDFDPYAAMIGNVNGKNTVVLPPSHGLFHEFFEQWRTQGLGLLDEVYGTKSDYTKWLEEEFDGNMGEYENLSDMYVIKLLESYVAKKFFGNEEELFRDSHNNPKNTKVKGSFDYIEAKSTTSNEPKE